jgi:hypothetical protein
MCYDDNSQHCRRFALALDLIAGLAYLHGADRGVAHLDVKHGNLIIDFNTAVRVSSEDHMVEGVYGAEGCMAPEIREGAVFSPIRADR